MISRILQPHLFLSQTHVTDSSFSIITGCDNTLFIFNIVDDDIYINGDSHRLLIIASVRTRIHKNSPTRCLTTTKKIWKRDELNKDEF